LGDSQERAELGAALVERLLGAAHLDPRALALVLLARERQIGGGDGDARTALDIAFHGSKHG
jgi:hypothetical protein